MNKDVERRGGIGDTLVHTVGCGQWKGEEGLAVAGYDGAWVYQCGFVQVHTLWRVDDFCCSVGQWKFEAVSVITFSNISKVAVVVGDQNVGDGLSLCIDDYVV